MKSTTSIMRKLTFVTAAFAAMTLLASSAMACKKGYLCFWDLDGNKGPKFASGKVSNNRSNWGKFKWDNRADFFINNGRYQNVCVYSGINYGGRVKRLIRKGNYYMAGLLMKNRVSSNKWIYGTC